MQRHRIINSRGDIFFLKSVSQNITIFRANSKLMINMFATGSNNRQNYIFIIDSRAISRRVLTARRVKLIYFFEFNANYRGLNLIKAAVITDFLMIITLRTAMVAQYFYLFRLFLYFL